MLDPARLKPGKILKCRCILAYPVNFRDKLCILTFRILSIWQNCFTPIPFSSLRKTFWSPPPSGNSKLILPSLRPPPITKVFLNTPYSPEITIFGKFAFQSFKLELTRGKVEFLRQDFGQISVPKISNWSNNHFTLGLYVLFVKGISAWIIKASKLLFSHTHTKIKVE